MPPAGFLPEVSEPDTASLPPVTSKAQQSPEYQDYLSRGGEDNETYYDVKMKASKLLLENTENTFVTPVFNGSASLRDAAGQMIETVSKSVKRKETVNEEYFTKLYGEVTSLYRLDQIAGVNGKVAGKAELGELPATASYLLLAIAGAWGLMAVYVLYGWIKKKKMSKKGN